MQSSGEQGRGLLTCAFRLAVTKKDRDPREGGGHPNSSFSNFRHCIIVSVSLPLEDITQEMKSIKQTNCLQMNRDTNERIRNSLCENNINTVLHPPQYRY